MKIIGALEPGPRSVYCGGIGFGNSRRLVFNVPIRTLVLDHGQGHMGVGSGIVYDSDPEDEYRESLLKGRFLTCPRPNFQLIETLLWQPDDGYLLLKDHLARLHSSASYFLYLCDIKLVRSRLEETAASFSNQAKRVRLLLARDGSMDISAEPVAGIEGMFSPDFQATTRPLLRVRISASRTDPDDIFLYHKTTRRTLYDQERARATAADIFEVIFINKHGQITEGTMSNVFVLKNKILLTPPRSAGLLAGTYRNFLITAGHAREQNLGIGDLYQNNGLFVGNSVRGLVKVQLAG